MPPEDEGDDETPARPPLPPEDRLWRHPSELASGRSGAGATTPPVGGVPGSRQRRWGLVVAGVAGATAALAVVAVTGVWRTKVVERQVAAPAAKVTTNTPVSLGAGSDVSGLVSRTSPSVVGVRVTAAGGTRVGSAVALGPSGNLVTSSALVRGGTRIDIGLADGSTGTATVLGSDPVTGLAVLDVGSAPLVAVREASRRPAIGSTAVMVPGSMTGGPGLVSSGIVRGLGQPAPTSDGTLHDLIQTDQAPSPESAGGALVGPDGLAVGITLLPSTDPTAAPSASGWAVPIDVARQVIDDISSDGHAHHVWLGVSISDQDRAPSFTPTGQAPADPAGALVTAVEPDSPAGAVGMQAGDKITAVDGTSVSSMADLISILRRHRPGDRVQVITWHQARSRPVAVVLKEQAPR